MEAATNGTKAIVQTARQILGPLRRLTGERTVFEFLDYIGWHLAGFAGPNTTQLITSLNTVATSTDALLATIVDPPEELDEVATALEELIELIDAIRALPDALDGFNAPNHEELAADLLNGLMIGFLQTGSPLLYAVLDLAVVIEQHPVEHIVKDGKLLRTKNKLPRVQWSHFAHLFSKPDEVFRDAYWPEGFGTEAKTQAAGKRLFDKVAAVLHQVGFQTLVGRGDGPAKFDPAAEATLEGSLTIEKRFPRGDDGVRPVIGGTFRLLSEPEGGPGLFAVPFGGVDVTHIAPPWLFSANLDGSVGGLKFTGGGVDFVAGSSIDLRSGAAATRIPAEGADIAFRIGKADGTRLEVKSITVRGELNVNGSNADAGVYASLAGGKIVINPGDGDGFISNILSGVNIAVEQDLEIGFSSASGFHFKNSGALEINIPSSISIGPATIQGLTVGIDPAEALRLKIGSTLALKIGGFDAVIENMGVKAEIAFPDGGGNLGPADLSVGLKPPSGIALGLQTPVVSGGGYLFFEPEYERYGGALQLSIAGKFVVTAVGLITTRMPDGSKGFSMILLLSVEFSPGISLAFGFFLSGLGGILGINRTMSETALRQSVLDGSIDKILFPQDVIANIVRIVSDIRAIFPPKQDQFLIGLMAKITWGVPQLVSVEFGLILEVSSPTRLAILGVLKVALPTEEAALVVVQVSFAGVLNFDEKYLSFDASLFGSRILTFTLEGDMALRLRWGSDPGFLMSVGGFHPAYVPPAAMQVGSLRRLTLNILSGNPRLTLTTYFALTSNTVQFGANIDFYFKVSKFKALGYFGFDVLFQFNPFRFLADIRAGIEIKLGSRTLMSISLSFSLAGPTPWIANGTASFKVLFIEVKVRFSKTWGERIDVSLPEAPVLPDLIRALEAPRNWTTLTDEARPTLVSYREVKVLPGQLVLQSAGRLQVIQTTVPLGIEIEKYGDFAPADVCNVRVKSLRLAGETIAIENVQERFAPAKFIVLDDREKLSSPNFTQENAGVVTAPLGGGEGDAGEVEYAVRNPVMYEVRSTDRPPEAASPLASFAPLELKQEGMSATQFSRAAVGGAIGRSALHREAKKRVRPSVVTVRPETYTVVRKGRLLASDLNISAGSRAEVASHLRRLERERPELRGKLRIVNTYQLADV